MQGQKKKIIAVALLAAMAAALVPAEALTASETARTRRSRPEPSIQKHVRQPLRTVNNAVYARSEQSQLQLRSEIKYNRQEIAALRAALQDRTQEIRRALRKVRRAPEQLMPERDSAIQDGLKAFREARAAIANNPTVPGSLQAVLASQRQRISALKNALARAEELLTLLRQ